jgi:uncharacterized protein YggE
MKRISFLLLLLAAPAFCEEPRSIQVDGQGIVKAEPDQVTLQFGIESNDRDLVKAKDDNTQKTKQLLDALKKFDIPSKDIQTGSVQINPAYDWINGKQTLRGYTAMKQISITLKDLNTYGKVLNAAVDAGVVHVNGLVFGNSKEDELKMEARKRAVADAKARAELLAGELKQKVGRPLMIQETSVPIYQPMVRGFAMMASDKRVSPEDTVSPGETTVSATVTVRFELQ